MGGSVVERLRGGLGPLRRRITLTFVVLLALFLTNALIVLAAARARDDSRELVENRLNPAQNNVERLLTALVNQESGQLGYQLTFVGSFDRGYRIGVRQEQAIVRTLRGNLEGHRRALGSLDAVVTTAAAWREHAKDEAAARRAGARSPIQLASSALRGTVLFGRARSAVATLSGEVATLQSQAQRAQGAADAWVLRSVATLVVTALVTVVAGLVVLRRSLTRPLEELVASIEGVKRGELAAPVQARGPREFVQVGSAVEAMRRRLLLDASETLNRSLIMATEDQRRRLAADIHDDPTQALTAVSLRLQRLRRRLVGEDAEMLVDAERSAAAALARLRNLIFELHSPILDNEGLDAAVRAYGEDTFDPEHVRFRIDSDRVDDLPPSVRALAYRLTCSALLNVAKHAHATSVTVVVRSQDERLAVRVTDDGRGFEPATAAVPEPGHLGLIASADFVRASGGRYTVTSAVGQGTTVEFWLPAGRVG